MEKFNIAELFYSSPILIPNHEHPLIHCFHPNESGFTCNNPDHEKINANKLNEKKQKGEEKEILRSFFCSFCDYDICDNCFRELELYKIVFYDPNQIRNKKIKGTGQVYRDKGWKKFNCHIHEMPLIIKGQDSFIWNWKCVKCNNLYYTNDYNNDCLVKNELYYCTLCNYSLCPECADKNEIK